MTQEHHLRPSDFVYPLFVRHGAGIRQEIASMPGVFHLSPDQLAQEAQEIAALGIPAVMLFGLPAHKDAIGSENFAPTGIVQQAIRIIKDVQPELVVITDVCLCEYTDHGHCFVIQNQHSNNQHFDNDATLEVLGRVAVSHAQAGADIVAPSGMVDGMIGAIRKALDSNGFSMTSIMSYAIKYASAFYGPFREAADSAPSFGDRHAYQMNPANAREAMREASLDTLEGADWLMVKPGLAYLDVLAKLRNHSHLPVAAYNVSGEYSMVKAAAKNGWIDEQKIVLETLLAFKRAGADVILSYHAKDAARWLRV